MFGCVCVCGCLFVCDAFTFESQFDEFLFSISFGFLCRCDNFHLQIVFNVVASVKFNEKLRDAVDINVIGTKKILDLVMGIKHLKVKKCTHS